MCVKYSMLRCGNAQGLSQCDGIYTLKSLFDIEAGWVVGFSSLSEG